MKYIYIIYEVNDCNEEPLLIACNSMQRAEEEKERLVQQWVEEVFAVDPEESGLDWDIDHKQIEKECRESLGIRVCAVLD